MFGKAKKRPSTNAHFETLIAQHCRIKGNLEFSGGLHVDGEVIGNLVATDSENAVLRLSDIARVEGDLIAPHIIINGRVNGNVYASEHLELSGNASITGTVFYNLIEMEMGAEVNGSLVHDRAQAAARLATPGERSSSQDPKESLKSGGAVDAPRLAAVIANS